MEQQVSQWKGPAIAFALFAALALGAFAWISSSRDSGLGNEHHAEAACEDFVKEKLKSPASADFSGAEVAETGEGEWTVTGTVDADNSFSAAMRGRYSCDVWTIDGDTYEGKATLVE